MFSLLLVICLSFTLGVPAVSAATNDNQSTFTTNSLSVEDYKNWITSKINMRDSNSYEAQIFLKEFNNLTEDEQELFVSYLSDSDLLLNIMNLLSSEETYGTLENGNVVVTKYQTSQDEEIKIGNRAAIQYRVGTGYESVSMFGLKIHEYSGEIRYSHDGSSIKEIQHANIWISTNFMPLVDFSWSGASTYGVGTRIATHINYCTWSFVHESMGLTYGTHQVEITGSVANETTFDAK